MKFLYDEFSGHFARRAMAAAEVPQSIVGNLKHRLRPYQVEAFKRFMLWQEQVGVDLKSEPHLLFNMATGSGKTLIMAGLMLLLYAQGKRNFLFFVNSSNIIGKTRDNFLAPETAKYLFAENINIGGEAVRVCEVNDFASADRDAMNIKFTTVQKLHGDLSVPKENRLTLDSFAPHEVVLIADEAHHLNAGVKQEKLLGTWEGTVEQLLGAGRGRNLLLEFTATVDMKVPAIADKYRDKIIYKYDLAQFRGDKYSKEINLVRSQYDEKERILQALLLSVYREVLAAENGINLKPVILFKAQQTIAQSQENKARFHQLIDELSAADVQRVRDTSGIAIVQRAFAFFDGMHITDAALAMRIRNSFTAEHCISANNDAEKEENQIRLNTLEDQNNPLRAVFAVQKLNEGWDVLNLFDIVRLYDAPGRWGKPSKTTIAEAQLIGRGARYFPFRLEAHQDAYQRKFDADPGVDLRVLEELYYHTRDDSAYLYELKVAMIDSGLQDDERNTDLVNLELKESFKQTDFYRSGQVAYNRKLYPPRHEIIRETASDLRDLPVFMRGFEYRLSEGDGAAVSMFDHAPARPAKQRRRTVALSEMQSHVVRYALTTNRFYAFSNLRKCFAVGATSEFIREARFLGAARITFVGSQARLDAMNNRDHLRALRALLVRIEEEVHKAAPEFKVSDFVAEYVHKVFKDKRVRVRSADAKGQKEVVGDADWYAYKDNYGTPEEREFVKMFAGYFEQMNKRYRDIYLLRNERAVSITNRDGQTFAPDFLLFCKPMRGRRVTWQIFIEPKGEGFAKYDSWKDEFLRELGAGKRTIQINAGEYRILGLPFYNANYARKFEEAFVDLFALEEETRPPAAIP